MLRKSKMAALVIFLLSSFSPISAQIAQAATVTRGEILHAYLISQGSPVAGNAQDFIDAADKYNLDWRLVAAVSGVESTFCKFVPGGSDEKINSHNCWGWGVYGDQAIYFKSWHEGIFTVSQGLREKYLDKGLTNPYAINQVYAASPNWGAKVTAILNDLDKFEESYQKANNQLTPNLSQAEVANSSAHLVTSQ